MKEAEKITEFLSIIGANNALFKFEDVRIVRDMRNSVNRLVNCETANLNKTIGAAFRQIENIKLIERTVGLEALPEKLREIAMLRVQHEDVSLKELGELVATGKISKSGINHRLKKIDEFAEKIKQGENLR
jgi:cell division protein WhiA